METQASKPPHPLVWAAAIALIVFCGTGFAALMGWIPTSLSTDDQAAFTKFSSSSASEVRRADAKVAYVARASASRGGTVRRMRRDRVGPGS